MLTRLRVRNFKRFDDIDIELGSTVVFIGPNNSGKTTALQALALWSIGLRRWLDRRGGGAATRRPGVAINRLDLVSLPVPEASLLWRNLHTRDTQRSDGKQQTSNVRVEIVVDGVTRGVSWSCGLEFDYANEESIYCRPLRIETADGSAGRMEIPIQAQEVDVAFLPPMSGLSDREFLKGSGEVSFLIGQGRTAEVLRNICFEIFRLNDRRETDIGGSRWRSLTKKIDDLFGIEILDPRSIDERNEIVMTYRERSGVKLDLSSAGRGLQQTLLILAYLSKHKGSVLLLDEPDAHLEILRQRQIYQVLTGVARDEGSQIVAASHSEVVLNEAAGRDIVVAFVGQPHRIDNRGSQVVKALRDIGFDHYYQAEQTGWVLYLEGSTDLAILQAFAATLGHAAGDILARPFVHYIANQPMIAREHFHGLREAKPDLVGFVLCDRLTQGLPGNSSDPLMERMWSRREIENYLCQADTLRSFAESNALGMGPLFESMERTKWREAMDGAISDLVPPVALRDDNDRWWHETKASDDFLDRLFPRFFSTLGLSNLMAKSDYHQLARHVPQQDIDPEVISVLDAIVEIAGRARPRV